MLKNLAWNTFKNTGNIDTLMELLEVKNIEKNIYKNIESDLGTINYGNDKNQGNSNIRK